MAKIDDAQLKKIEFLENRENILKRRVSTAERKLLDVVISDFLDKLEQENGQIKFNGKNIELTQALDKIFDTIGRNINSELISTYVNDISRLGSLNASYFKLASTDKSKVSGATKKARRAIFNRLGINSKGKTTKGGFLSEFIGDTRTRNQLKEIVTNGITSGQGFKEMKSNVQTFVVGNNEVQGQLQSNYRTFIYDTYNQIDRFESGIYADVLGMDSFKYLGGKVADTREFCCQRNGLIFTIDEAKKWQSLRFQGKNKNYNPLIDLGGYNCRHSTQYIANEIAVKRRKDLTINDEGKLVPKKGESKQKLHKC